MKYFSYLLVLLLLSSSAVLAQGDPFCNGENCDEAYPINGFPYSNSRNSCNYNDDGFNSSPDVFYRFELTQTANVLITLCNGSLYDTYLWLLADDCATEIAMNDDACGLVSELDLPCLTPGVYYIVVEGYWTDCGCYTLDVTQGEPCGVPTLIEPSGYALLGNYPNPFNPVTTIAFNLAEPQHAVLTVYSLTGETVATLIDSDLPVGEHSVQFDASRLNSGIYFYRLVAGDFSASKKMTVVK